MTASATPWARRELSLLARQGPTDHSDALAVDLIDLEAAATILDTTADTIVDLVDDGHLSSAVVLFDDRQVLRFARHDVEALVDAVAERTSHSRPVRQRPRKRR